MSLMSMRRKMASKQTAMIIWVLVVVFIAGIALISIPPSMRGGGGGTAEKGAQRDPGVIATVGGEAITRGEFDNAFELKIADADRYAGMMGGGGDQFAKISKARKDALNEVIQRHLLNQALKKFGIKMSDGLYRKIATADAKSQIETGRKEAEKQAKQSAEDSAKSTATVKPPVKTTDEILGEMMTGAIASGQPPTPGKKTSESDFINFAVNKALDTTNGQDETFKFDAAYRTLGEYIATEFAKTDIGGMEPLTEAYIKRINTEEVKASWIYISAEKSDAASLAAAKKKADELYETIVKDPKKFGEIARTQSKDIYTKETDGALGKDGWLNQGNKKQYGTSTLPGVAEYLAYALKPGEMSPVTQMSYYSQQDAKDRFGKGFTAGYAFVKVDDNSRPWEEKKSLDWNKEKAELISKAQGDIARDFAQSYLDVMRYQTTIETKDDEIAYWLASYEMEVIKADELLPKVYAMSNKLPRQVQSVIAYNMSNLPQKLPESTGNQDDATRKAAVDKQQADKAKYLEEALPDSGDQAPQLYLKIGRIYSSLNKKDDAIRCFTNAAQSDDKDKQLHEDLKAEFIILGDTKNVDMMAKWLEDHKNDKPEAPGGMGGMDFGQ